MTQSPKAAPSRQSSFEEPEVEDSQSRRSRKRVAIKRPPRVPNDEGDADRRSSRSSIRRTRTLPTGASRESNATPSERRSRRNLSRMSSAEFPDDFLLDSGKRLSTSRRAVDRSPSERVLKPSLSTRSGRAATPLDIPFAPSRALDRTRSAESRFEELLDMEVDEPKSTIRRTRTHVPTSQANLIRHQSSLKQDAALRLDLEALARTELELTPSEPPMKGHALAEDSAKGLQKTRSSQKGGEALTPSSDASPPDDAHVITIERPSEKRVQESRSSRKDVGSVAEKKPGATEAKPLTWFQLMLHFVALIFVQYPFRYHRQWREKMYKSNRLPKPEGYRPPPDWALNSGASSYIGGTRGVSALPSLPENSSVITPRSVRTRRRAQLDVDDPNDEFGSAVGGHHRKRPSRILPPLRPPPGHLPRSQNISERSRQKKARRSVEIFGDIMHALGVNTKGGRLKLPFGLTDLDESELSGFQARLYKFIKRQHKGRLARAWEHVAHPLGSMQKKHRRSTNKTLLLNAIDKQKAQKFDNAVDMIQTRTFLFGQWVFEALSPPKYTKKPMLFTVLFPLVLILFFGFMAGEYPLWRQSVGEAVDYDYGPEELATWLFRAEKWRTFESGFLILWGARYLPLVTTESWRWLFSMLVHENFAHLGGNLFLFVILSWSLESKYGFVRTGLICWLSGISGNFMSATLEDSCGLVLGASGCIFGLAAFYIVDVIGDFKYVSFPCLRLMGICTFLTAFIIALTSHQEASHFSHIGGFLCGMGLSVVLVPRFLDERIEAFLPWIALFSGLVLLCIFPLVVLISVIPNLQCPS